MKSAASFITQLVSVSREVEPLVPIVNTHGETLFMQVSLEPVLDFVYVIIRAATIHRYLQSQRRLQLGH